MTGRDAMANRRGGGMDGAKVQLPSGRWLHQLGELSQLTLGELAWVVAHYMLSHAQGGVFRGSVPTAIRATWPHQAEHPQQRNVPRVLRGWGFTPHQEPGGPFTWRVPAELPEMTAAAGMGGTDTGEQTSGGPVRVIRKAPAGSEREPLHWTQQMAVLAVAVREDPARHPREYAARLGWTESATSSVGRTLRRYGIIEARGRTAAARYYPTDVELPAKVRRRGRNGRTAPRPAEPGPASADATAPAPPPPPAPAAQGFPADFELRQLASILEAVAALSPESKAWLRARLTAEGS